MVPRHCLGSPKSPYCVRAPLLSCVPSLSFSLSRRRRRLRRLSSVDSCSKGERTESGSQLSAAALHTHNSAAAAAASVIAIEAAAAAAEASPL